MVFEKTDGHYYTTDLTSAEVLQRNHAHRCAHPNNDEITAVFRLLQYGDPFKGRAACQTLQCQDGEELHRVIVDGVPLVYSDETDLGGWMTFEQLLIFIEGYRRLTDFEEFIEAAHLGSATGEE